MNTLFPKQEMDEELGRVLRQLDGTTMCDCVDFFYRRDPIDTSTLRFCGENEKMDIFEWAVDEGCLPPLDNIHAGTDASGGGGIQCPNQFNQQPSTPDMEERLRQEMDYMRAKVRKEDARSEKSKKRVPKKVTPLARQIDGRQKALAKMRASLDGIVNEGVRAHQLAKIQKAEEALAVLRAKAYNL